MLKAPSPISLSQFQITLALIFISLFTDYIINFFNHLKQKVSKMKTIQLQLLNFMISLTSIVWGVSVSLTANGLTP